MIRKARARTRSLEQMQKTHNSSSTPTIGSSRRSRIVHMLGITTFTRSQNDSVLRTQNTGEGPSGAPGDWQRLDDIERQKPDPRIWTTVERVDSQAPEAAVSEADIRPGMKKTVWNVRR